MTNALAVEDDAFFTPFPEVVPANGTAVVAAEDDDAEEEAPEEEEEEEEEEEATAAVVEYLQDRRYSSDG